MAADVVDGCVIRQPKAYPVYDDDYKLHVDTIRRAIEEQYPTLHLVGRNGMHKYNNQDHAMMTALLAARNILAGKRMYDVWSVNEDAQYHEAGEAGAPPRERANRCCAHNRGALMTAATTIGAGSPPVSRLRFWLPRLAIAILAPILLLALTEGALRLFHVGHSTALMEPCTIHGRPYSCYNLFFAAPFFPARNDQDAAVLLDSFGETQEHVSNFRSR